MFRCERKEERRMKKILKYCFNTSVWTPTRDQWTQMLACVPGEECETIHRFVFKSDCKQRLVGQLLVRHCLHAPHRQRVLACRGCLCEQPSERRRVAHRLLSLVVHEGELREGARRRRRIRSQARRVSARQRAPHRSDCLGNCDRQQQQWQKAEAHSCQRLAHLRRRQTRRRMPLLRAVFHERVACNCVFFSFIFSRDKENIENNHENKMNRVQAEANVRNCTS